MILNSEISRKISSVYDIDAVCETENTEQVRSGIALRTANDFKGTPFTSD